MASRKKSKAKEPKNEAPAEETPEQLASEQDVGGVPEEDELEDEPEPDAEPDMSEPSRPEPEPEPEPAEESAPKRELMRLFKADIDAVFSLANSAGLDADEKSAIQAKFDAGVTEDELDALRRELRTRAVRREQTFEEAKAGKAGKYRALSNLRLGRGADQRLVKAGDVTQLNEQESRHFMKAGAVEPV